MKRRASERKRLIFLYLRGCNVSTCKGPKVHIEV